MSHVEARCYKCATLRAVGEICVAEIHDEYRPGVRITRCPRCLAEDITADAHPSRRLQGGMPVAFYVCRECFRAAELEFQIACEGAHVAYARLPIRESLRLLRAFYQDRQRELPDDERITAALQEVERRLQISPVERASKLDR
jgi:hypothetical protein